MRYRLLLLLMLIPSLALPVQAAGIFGRKKDKVAPKARVPELVAILKADGDADKRMRAAEELRNYDPAIHPEIIPALVEALQNDKKPNVRAEAAQSLGKIRPVTPLAGEALERALANDSSMRVRLQARSSLLGYHWAGYRSGKQTEVPPLAPTTKEPPIINTNTPTTVTRPGLFPSLRPAPARPVSGPRGIPTALTPPVPSTKEPPLALPESTPAPVKTPSAPPAITTGGSAVPEAGPELP